MVSLVAAMNPEAFLTDIRKNNDTLLNVICDQGNYKAAKALSTLPIFKEIINDESGAEGWTPILNASRRPDGVDTSLFKLLIENGAQILKPK